MTPADWLVLAMGLQCLAAAVLYVTSGNLPFAALYASYFLANGALLWISMSK